MEQRISMITLGVSDLDRARAFYAALGWRPSDDSPPEIAFFQAGGMIFSLWDRALLGQDAAITDGGGWGGVTLAYNVRSTAEVDATIEEARAAGAKISHEPAATDWGGYSGHFIDPDGHSWEVAHNPDWPILPDGSVSLTR
jgi:catechol 2,3-dioxygenase-like lactoylglutathione lyase family enzyme